MILRKESLDDLLERIRELYDGGKYEQAWKEIRRGRKRHPADLTLLEWEATCANDDGRYEEALAILEKVLAAESGRPFSLREKAASLLGLGRFQEALALLDEIGPDNAGDVEYHFDRALCLDREGRTEEADKEFRKAARLDPETYRKPLRLTREEFEGIVRDSLDEIPEQLRRYLDNVIVEVMEYPRSPPLEPGIDPNLLGLYVGVPRTERSHEERGHLDRIFVFKRNLEIEFPDRKILREEIRKTVIHEIAHHFGLGEDEMGWFE